MEAIKRKKIARVGSGAFSLYIPKKWIDEWTDVQAEEREVDLHQINESLLLTPVHRDRSFKRTMEDDAEKVTRTLLSCYIRGLQDVSLQPEGSFGSATQSIARRTMRHLDERLIATSRSDCIGFQLNPNLPTSTTDHKTLLRTMGAKLQEGLQLARESVESHDSDPARTLHSLQMLVANHDEEVSRIFYQSGRLVANLELPLDAVSDFQLLGLATADMYRMSIHTVAIAHALLEAYGASAEQLAYPVEHLLENIQVPDQNVLARDVNRGYGQAFADASKLLNQLMEGLATGDMDALKTVANQAGPAIDDMQTRIFTTIQHHWGKGVEPHEAMETFNAYRVSIPLGSFMGAIRVLANHSLAFLEAQ